MGLNSWCGPGSYCHECGERWPYPIHLAIPETEADLPAWRAELDAFMEQVFSEHECVPST